MKKKFVIVIVLLLILLIIIGIIIFFKIYKLSTSENVINETETNTIVEESIETVSDYNLFYTIETLIQKYETFLHLNYEQQLNELNQPSVAAVYGITTQEEKTNAIINLLDNEFIKEYNINTGNVIEILGQYTNEVETKILEINTLKSSNKRVSAYSVSTEITNIDNKEKISAMFIVKLDNINTTFSIYPIINNEYSNLYEINVENTIEKIEKNSNNIYVLMEYNESQIATKYFQEYKNLMLSNSNDAYNKLDEEYKNKRFGSVENFIEYVNNKKKDIENSQIMKYQVEENNGNKEYICMLNNGKYWIIKESKPANYTVILDTYTIDLPQFIEKYNSSSDAEKVLLNIQKIFSAINDGDYNYVYNKLDNTFKQNNFPTLESFSNYIKQNFYENNSIGYSNYKTSGDLHIYEISITDKDNEDNEANPTVTKNFIMQLKDGTDFVMSFNV